MTDEQTSGNTKPTQFRLPPQTLADLDAIATHLSAETGIEHNRTDAVKASARKLADLLKKKSGKKKP